MTWRTARIRIITNMTNHHTTQNHNIWKELILRQVQKHRIIKTLIFVLKDNQVISTICINYSGNMKICLNASLLNCPFHTKYFIAFFARIGGSTTHILHYSLPNFRRTKKRYVERRSKPIATRIKYTNDVSLRSLSRLKTRKQRTYNKFKVKDKA